MITPIILDIQHDRVDKIYHVADIHIRNVKRHHEYRIIFDKFFDEIKKNGTKNSIVFVGGDIAHSKVETSPELVREISYFLSSLATLTDTIIIPGNHDCNLSNKHRLDVISPIVANLNHDRIHYLKDNALFKCKNILFSHYSIFSDYSEYIKYDKIPSKYKNEVETTIALFHGAMNASKTDGGYEVSSQTITPKMFDGFDMVLLGDIHKYQIMQSYDPINLKPVIAYCGSLVQQNHGEELAPHGYTLWDVNKKTHNHVHINNDYGFFTAEIKSGKLVTDLTNMPCKAHLRLRCFDSEPSQVKEIVSELKKHNDFQEVSYVRGDDKRDIKRNSKIKFSLAKLNDVTFQNNLIKEYLKRNHSKITDKVLNDIFELNKEINGKLASEDKASFIQWIPKRFEFENMFSYGEGNIIEFENLRDMVGLFANNATGKSSFIDSLCFCMFDKSSRAFKGSHIMNDSKMSFKCQFTFEIDGIDYVVKRTARRDKKNGVKVNVDFFRIVDGDIESLNGDSRSTTNAVIRQYLGTFEDFILTTLSLQKNHSNFADKGQTERKDLIARFMGIVIFDKLFNISTDETREMNAFLKKFKKENFSDTLVTLEFQLHDATEKFGKMIEVVNEVSELKESVTEKISNLQSTIVNLVGVVEDVDSLELELNKKQECVKEIDIIRLESECDTFIKDNEVIIGKIKKFDDNNINDQKEKYDTWKVELEKIENELEVDKVTVGNLLEKIKFLDEHKYDPDCKYCMENAFVKNALTAKVELAKLKLAVEERVYRKKELRSNIETSTVLDDFVEYESLKKQYSENETAWHKCINKVQEKEKDIIHLKNDIATLERQIQRYYDAKESVTKNKEIKIEIDSLKITEADLNKKIKIGHDKMMTAKSNIEVLKSQKEEIKRRVKEVREMEKKLELFYYYTEAIGRDGVPYDLICQAVPTIESEVNSILTQIVDFGMTIDMDGKNINANIVREDRSWPLELNSGMESFISNLALRIALSNISNLPRSNFLIIDEGLGALDHEHLASVYSLFGYLKTQFEFIILISHIDSSRDMVDMQIEIKKENGFSKIVVD